MHLTVATPPGTPRSGTDRSQDGTCEWRASVRPPELTWPCPGIQKHLVTLLAQGWGLSAARPLEVEAEGSATESRAQPGLPTKTEDLWKTKKLDVTASSYQFRASPSTGTKSPALSRSPSSVFCAFPGSVGLYPGLPGTPDTLPATPPPQTHL